MKCERCGIVADNLHDYCDVCSQNLCERCMHEGTCTRSHDRKHKPANHGECTTCGADHVDGYDCFGERIAPTADAPLTDAPRALVEWCDVCQMCHHVNPQSCS